MARRYRMARTSAGETSKAFTYLLDDTRCMGLVADLL